MAMTGGTIDIEEGGLRNGGWQSCNWDSNQASMNIAAGATFYLWAGQPVAIDALTGSGTIDHGYWGSCPLTIGIANGSGTWSGNIAASEGSVTKTGAGTEVFASPNTYGDPTYITGGVLQLADPNAVQNSTVNVNVDNGLTFGPGVGTFNLGGLSGSGAVPLADTNGNAVAIQVGGNNQDATYSGALSGSGSVIKTGNGVQTLSGAGIAYTGDTTVTGGTLQLVNAINFSNTGPGGSTPANTITIASGAVLQLYLDATTSWSPFEGEQSALGTPATTIVGAGVFQKTGPGILELGGQGGGGWVTFAMSGGMIDIEGGTLRNGGWQGQNWTNNLASLNVAGGATLDIWNGNQVFVDAVTGAGIITSNYGGAPRWSSASTTAPASSTAPSRTARDRSP